MMSNDTVIALAISMIANIVLVAVNNYLIFAILTRFKEYMKGKEKTKNE